MHKKLAVFLMAAGAALIAGALLLIVHNRTEDARAGDRAEELVHTLRALIPAAESASPEPEAAPAAEPSAEIDGESYIGVLSIPALGLELPVADRCDSASLKTAPGRYYGSAAARNLVIAGHNYDTHFGRLSLLSAGDAAVFTAADGHTYTYSVALLETLAPTAAQEMTDSGYDLTLYTCTYGGQSRVTVRCTLVGEE